MKLTFDIKTFIDAANWVGKTFDHRSNSSYIALSVNSDSQAHLFYLNSTSYMKAPFIVSHVDLSDEETDSDDRKVFALDGVFLSKLSSVLSGSSGNATMKRKKGSMEVLTQSGKFSIPTVEKKVQQEPDLTDIGEVDERQYFEALKNLSKLCDNTGSGPSLSSVDISFKDDTIVLMATDRYVLGEITVPFDPSNNIERYMKDREGKNLLLPVENAALISPSKNGSVSTTLVYDEKSKKFGYQFLDGRVSIFSLNNAEPLAYLKLKENASKGNTETVTIETKQLKQAISSVSNVSWEEKEIVLNIASDGSLKVHDLVESNTVSVPVLESHVSQDFSPKFSRVIINEAFYPITTSKVVMKWAPDGMTFVFEPLTEDDKIVDSVFVFFIRSK